MDRILIVDFGSQYSHLIARRIRDLGVYSEMIRPNEISDNIGKDGVKGLILSGGAMSVYDEKSPKMDREILNYGVPILGICYGHQLIASLAKGTVEKGSKGEYGLTGIKILDRDSMCGDLVDSVWMNHKDIVSSLPEDFRITASTDNSPVAAFENTERNIYGVQFHPEVSHTKNGIETLKRFIFDACKAETEWNTSDILSSIESEIITKLRGKKALIALSGGIDSSVACVLVNSIIGKDLTAVYVDTGLMRHKETEFVRDTFSKMGVNLRIVDARDRFFSSLKGVADPEEKRKAIGKTFIDVFEEVSEKIDSDVLIQGTIYSDRIESGVTDHSSSIKSHHNVGGLPENLDMEIYEPLRDLYKDEVRKIASEIGLLDSLVKRQVFPGPGIAVRIIGEVTQEKAEIVRSAHRIIEEELKESGLWNKVWMAFAVLLPVKSVGIQGDSRSYKYPIVLRVIESDDAMTANFSRIPYDILEKISSRITNEIEDVNRVVYDITNKPPATMEWE